MRDKEKNKSSSFRGDLVKKDNVLNEGIYTLDTAEKYKLMLLMIAQISTQDEIPSSPEEISNKTYGFYLDDYAELKKVKDKYSFEDYISQLVFYLKQNSAVTIKSENSIKTIWIFQEVDFQKDKKGWKVVFQFSHSIAKYLFELKERFLAYHIRNIMPMRSKYSIRLYELLKQYEKIGERTFHIDDFKEKVGTRVYIIDPKTQEKKVLEDNYKNFADLRKQVINRAVKELNEFSDIEIIDIEYIRQGRGGKVEYITFKFKPKLNFNFQKTEEIKEKAETDKNKILQESKKEVPSAMEAIWKNIKELREYYGGYIEDILAYTNSSKGRPNTKINRLSENEILFLLINADKDLYDENMVASIIKKAVTNKKLKNPIGFLINTLGINMKTARFTELTLTNSKIDEELFKQKLENNLVTGKPAKEYIKAYWNKVITPSYKKGEMDKSTVHLLKDPLLNAVYDEIENVIYIPSPDEIYKEWFEGNFLEEIKRFLNQKFDIENVIIEVLERE